MTWSEKISFLRISSEFSENDFDFQMNTKNDFELSYTNDDCFSSVTQEVLRNIFHASVTSPKSVSFKIRDRQTVFLLHESGTCFLRFSAFEYEWRGQESFSFEMKAFTVSVLFGIVFFVQMTISYGRENIDRPFYEGELESTVQSINEDAGEDETDPEQSEYKNENVHDVVNKGEEEGENVQGENDRKRKRENSSKKRSHPQVCPPGWLSPWDFTDNSNCGGCGCGNCGCGGGFGGGISGSDELDSCGCGEYGFGGGCGCGCGGCGCKFHGGFMGHNGFGRRLPRLSNDGRIQHVWLSKCEEWGLF